MLKSTWTVPGYRRRKIANYVFIAVSGAAAVGAIAVLFIIMGYVLGKGFGSINFEFFTTLPKPVGETGGGMANAMVGSLIVLGLASAVALPVGIGAAIYLAEFRATGGQNFVRFVIETMTGIPSIVVGIFAYTIVVKPMGSFSAIAGGVALAVIMIPIFARAAEVALGTVPFSLREASLALGVPVWRTVIKVVLPTAAPGLITAFMLAIARAGGETAPLLFTALGNRFWHEKLTHPINTLPVQVYTYAIGPYGDWHRQAWAGALVMVGITVIIVAVVKLAFRGTAIRE